MRPTLYQLSLIFLGFVATAMFGVFFYRELFPEYRIYQNDYVALEEFRSGYTKEPPPFFKEEVKQIVIEREDRGPAIIDRCTSCHVALQYEHFSPTIIAKDINGNIVMDEQGIPVKVANENYVWAKLDDKIAELSDPKVIDQMQQQGESSAIKARLKEAEKLSSLKTAHVGEHIYDVRKVLVMHPLIGRETRPFEFHPIDDYGCVSCHNGNGRGLTTEKAHGPVFDEQYEIAFLGPEPKFTEEDPKNDPQFAHMFNHMPGHQLLFQTTPIFIGPLIQAKCVQCHQSSNTALQSAFNSANLVTGRRGKISKAIFMAFENEKEALISLLQLEQLILSKGIEAAISELQLQVQDYTLPTTELDNLASQLKFLKKIQEQKLSAKNAEQEVLNKLSAQIQQLIGSPKLVNELESLIVKRHPGNDQGGDKGKEQAQNLDSYQNKQVFSQEIDKFLEQHRKDADATGSLFAKAIALDLEQEIMQHVQDTEISLEKAVTDQTFVSKVVSDIDILTKNYQHGQELYLSQGCYACHRISGFTRGGVGPELSRIGNSYPWFIKESIVWPQADTPASTMPVFRLDHEELQDLMTFLLGQKGESKAISETSHKIAIQEWEAGKKMPWEQPITPNQMKDLRYSMTVFATEGCASCHRLEGFQSDVGFSIEKEANGKVDFERLYSEKEWFSKLFPESIIGSELVEMIDKNEKEIDQRIVHEVRNGSILEEIEKTHPGTVEGLYSDFKYALRAKDNYYAELAKAESDVEKKAGVEMAHQNWKDRVRRVMLMYVQEYGLGRLICPRPNWSGVFRGDEWLMEHFRNPTTHVPRSIMPVFPFDDTKFYALTYMLDVLGIRNRNSVHAIWENRGFNPEMAFQIHCAQCHGEFGKGNGPVAEWIYPIPKNLRNADFLRNLTKEEAIQSITHGVKGTPMPPWGEVAKDSPTADGIPVLTTKEISRLVDWLFSSLPGGEVIKSSREVPKWHYQPKDVIQELHREGIPLKGSTEKKEIPSEVLEIFDVKKSPKNSLQNKSNTELDDEKYFIKKKFYTEENISQGKQFFELNCAPCHGKEADGAGLRASFMQDAKPRMLTNLGWINTRDDLRLLRSIKYGVPGTSMTPWGDLTTSLQRLQLVIFIRSLVEERKQRDILATVIYQTFEEELHIINTMRIEEYAELIDMQNKLKELSLKRSSLEEKAITGKDSAKELTDLYGEELALSSKLRQRQEIDQKFMDLMALLKQEEEVYQNLGIAFITKEMGEEFLQIYVDLIALNKGRYSIADGKLMLIESSDEKDHKSEELKEKLVGILLSKIESLEKEKSLENSKELSLLISGYIKLKNKLIADLEQTNRLRQKQKEIYSEFNLLIN